MDFGYKPKLITNNNNNGTVVKKSKKEHKSGQNAYMRKSLNNIMLFILESYSN